MQDDETPLGLDELYATGAEVRDGHAKANAIMGSTLAIVSLISSFVLIWMIKRSHISFKSTYHRILLGMTIADIIYSLSLAHFNMMAPSEDDYFVWNASGNQLTCNVQGFLTATGATSGLLYNCSLNLYSLAVVKNRKSDEYIRKKIEPFLHGVPIVYALALTITLLIGKNTNDSGGGSCYAPEYRPPHCIGYKDGEVRDGFTIPCGRGHDGFVLFYYLSGFITAFVVPIVVGVSLGMIYKVVRMQENVIGGYGESNFSRSIAQRTTAADDDNANNNNEEDEEAPSSWREKFSWCKRCKRSSTSSNSRAVMDRATAYSVAYFLAWSFFIIGSCFTLVGVEWPTTLWYLATIFNPLQGFFNFCIFMYPKVNKAKSRGGDETTWLEAFGKAFWSRGRNPNTGTR